MKKIALCGSVTNYKAFVEAKNEIVKLGFEGLIPLLAEKMEKTGNYNKAFLRQLPQ